MPRTAGVSASVERRFILLRPKTNERCTLVARTALWAGNLLNRDRLSCCCFSHSDLTFSYSATASVVPRRRTSLTFLPRRDATERGLACLASASNVARTML